MPRHRIETAYHDTHDAFRRIWESKSVASDLRLYICGAVHQAGVRQGDEVIPIEIWEKLLLEQPLDVEEITEMVESVHKFVIIDKKIRNQYLLIVLRMIDGYLSRAATAAYGELMIEAQTEMTRLN